MYESLSTPALLEAYEDAMHDVTVAAATQRYSEWHVASCAALLGIALELSKRNLENFD